ncbi:SIR2 family protein [Pedobacter xixiisoli]|uniref:SIR2-like domain-containing protein n=1 Tax=Pedobacter xixiisoli TaxID=1476464 RepID=A0A285ZRJ4_9SPHI|nr:SIR2 family protein [Pedobacter xixiisoli]SOD12260.1 SIR2-like domain-containing protein [Pedobacter xixiisoli]
MGKINHFDPSEYIRGVQQILISDKKKIGFLFGAGSSLAKKHSSSLVVPAIGKMTEEIVEELSNGNKKNENVFSELKEELGEKFNIETLLSNLELKLSFISKAKLNGINKEELATLIQNIKKSIHKKVSVHISDGEIVSKEIIGNLVQADFSKWIGQADRKHPVEIFTTNYDFLFELGLEHNDISYYDGFCGSLRPFFNPHTVEDLRFLPNQTKLWKIHGSLGWSFDNENQKILRSISNDEDFLIYPSTLKYKDSKKQPYESLLDRLSNFIKQDDSVLITCGYSWGDEHINSRILSALKTNTTSHVLALFYDKYDKITIESNISKIGLQTSKISVYATSHAIIGCKYGKWRLKSEPNNDDTINVNQYFDEDAPILESEELNKEYKGEEKWTGEGEFKLSDFGNLVSFLQIMLNEDDIIKLSKNGKK